MIRFAILACFELSSNDRNFFMMSIGRPKNKAGRVTKVSLAIRQKAFKILKEVPAGERSKFASRLISYYGKQGLRARIWDDDD
jgi:hypothetical protein